jgi:hypothetical protein
MLSYFYTLITVFFFNWDDLSFLYSSGTFSSLYLNCFLIFLHMMLAFLSLWVAFSSLWLDFLCSFYTKDLSLNNTVLRKLYHPHTVPVLLSPLWVEQVSWPVAPL